jgi:hypothetical protein
MELSQHKPIGGQPAVIGHDALMHLWTELGDVPVDDEGRIQERFLHFDAGTPIKDVWRWFESSSPNFSVHAAMFPATCAA